MPTPEDYDRLADAALRQFASYYNSHHKLSAYAKQTAEYITILSQKRDEYYGDYQNDNEHDHDEGL